MEPKRQAARKRKVVQKRIPLVATTLEGLEPVLAKELATIGGNDIREVKRAVTFTGDKDLIYKAKLRLRTALRILKPLRKFIAGDEEELYDGIYAIDWTEIFEVDKTFAVKTAVSGSLFTNSHFVALKCKDAIVDQFRERVGKRPSIETRYSDLVIHVKVQNDRVSVSLDSSGTPLNKRGYRVKEAIAPLNECLAAGMLLAAGYDGRMDFIDPMCGSGTLCIEAAMIAFRVAPGLMREKFAFTNWKDFDHDLFEIIRDATIKRVREAPVRIIGYDRSFQAIRLAREAAERAELTDAITFRMEDFFEMEPPPPPAILVMNPPYDERIRIDQAERFYSRIGDKLKKDFTGYQAWILSGNQDAMKKVGLRTFQTYHLVNGKIPCRYSGYRLYRGSKSKTH